VQQQQKLKTILKKKSSFTQSLPNPSGKNKSQDSSRLCKTALHFNFDIPLKQCALRPMAGEWQHCAAAVVSCAK
jgi:hypothetical protein